MGRVAATVGLAVVLAMVSLMVPQSVRAGSTDYDFAAGGGKFASGDFAVSVNCPATGAVICLQGSSPSPIGKINKHYADPSTGKMDEIHGNVTCLMFNYPYAWISWTVSSSQDSAYPVGATYTFGVADTGGPANGSASDLILIDQSSGPSDCTLGTNNTSIAKYSFVNTYATAGVLSGQVQVHQAATTPGTTLSGAGWYTDSSGNLYVLDSNTGAYVLVQ